MTYGTRPLAERRPGAFYARCNLARTVKERLAKPEDKEEAKRLDLPRRKVEVDWKGRPVWAWDFPHAEGAYEFTDKASYLEHMATLHRGGAKLRGVWMGGRWTGPRLKPEGQPLPKAAREVTRPCPHGCGLVAEVRGDPGSELWWDEHLRGCMLARAGAVS